MGSIDRLLHRWKKYIPGFCHFMLLLLFLRLLFSVNLIGMALSFIRSYKKEAMKIVEIPVLGFSRNFGFFDASALYFTRGRFHKAFFNAKFFTKQRHKMMVFSMFKLRKQIWLWKNLKAVKKVGNLKPKHYKPFSNVQWVYQLNILN